MPLPPALAARLLKRGLLKQTDPEEEVIAEDYDEDHTKSDGGDKSLKNSSGAPGCPNAWNPYHSCVEFCYKVWSGAGTRTREPDADRERRRKKLIKKYPLPPEWQEVLDDDSVCYYYWNMKTDDVSWLPPTHPKAKITVPASRLPKPNTQPYRRNVPEQKKRHRSDEEGGGSGRSSSEEESERPPGTDVDRRGDRRRSYEPRPKRTSSSRHGGQRDKGRSRRNVDDELDPMDPSAYSDTPRGTWAAGLPKGIEAKTGVDSTATGPLFQMRPYPSPGAVLRANQGGGGGKK